MGLVKAEGAAPTEAVINKLVGNFGLKPRYV